MSKIAILIVAALILASCDYVPVQQTYKEVTDQTSVALSITDYGMVDGCRVKWIRTREYPSFWMVRCNGTVSASSEWRSGKSTQHSNAVVEDGQ